MRFTLYQTLKTCPSNCYKRSRTPTALLFSTTAVSVLDTVYVFVVGAKELSKTALPFDLLVYMLTSPSRIYTDS